MSLVLRRARAARSLLLAATGVTMIATILLTSLVGYSRAVVAAGAEDAVGSAAADERSMLVRGAAGRTAGELTQRDAALRARMAGGLGGRAVTVIRRRIRDRPGALRACRRRGAGPGRRRLRRHRLPGRPGRARGPRLGCLAAVGCGGHRGGPGRAGRRDPRGAGGRPAARDRPGHRRGLPAAGHRAVASPGPGGAVLAARPGCHRRCRAAIRHVRSARGGPGRLRSPLPAQRLGRLARGAGSARRDDRRRGPGRARRGRHGHGTARGRRARHLRAGHHRGRPAGGAAHPRRPGGPVRPGHPDAAGDHPERAGAGAGGGAADRAPRR